MKKYIYIVCLFISFSMFILNVKAINYINNVFRVTLDGNNSINNEEEISININIDVRYELASVLGDIVYDKNKLTFTNCESDYFTCTQTDKILLDSTNSIKGNKKIAKLTFKVLDNFKPNDDVTIEFKNVEGDNNTAGNNSKITIHRLNNNTSLSTLTVDNETLVPTFTPTNTTYRINTTKNSININATSSSEITGTGKKNLDYGNNIFKIKVTSEIGEIKEYLINVFREEQVVNNNGSETTNNPKNSANTSTNNKSKNNNNTTKNNNSNTSNNNPSNTKKLSSNKKLKYLKIKDIDFELKEDVFEYNINIDSNIKELNIDYELEDKKSKVVISGDTKFTKKENLVTISVIAEDGSQTDYKIHVNKHEDDTTITVNDTTGANDKEEVKNINKNINKKNKNNYTIPIILAIVGIGIVVLISIIKKKVKK